jgi:hypothetical protein
MTYERSLEALRELKKKLTLIDPKIKEYDESVLKDASDDEYVAGLPQAIWNIADHLERGMGRSAFLGGLVAAIALQLQSYKDTIFINLDYLHRKKAHATIVEYEKFVSATKNNADKKQERKQKIIYIKENKWVPEVLNAQTYQLCILFKEGLLSLVKDKDMQGLLYYVPFQAMIDSLTKRIEAYELANPDEVQKILEDNQPQVEATPIAIEEPKEEIAIAEPIVEKNLEEQLEQAKQRIIQAEDVIKGLADNLDVEINEEALERLRTQASQRKQHLLTILQELKTFYTEIKNDIIPSTLVSQQRLFDCMEFPAYESVRDDQWIGAPENLKNAIMELNKRLEEYNNRTLSQAIGTWGTLAGVGKELYQKAEWNNNKDTLLTEISKKQYEIEVEHQLSIDQADDITAPQIQSSNDQNIYTLKQRYQAEFKRLQTLYEQKLNVVQANVELQQAKLHNTQLELQDLLAKQDIEQHDFDEKLGQDHHPRKALTPIAQQVKVLNQHQKRLQQQEQAFQNFEEGDLLTSYHQCYDKIRALPETVQRSHQRLMDERTALRQNITQTRQKIEAAQTVINKLFLATLIEKTRFNDTGILCDKEKKTKKQLNKLDKYKVLIDELANNTNEDIIELVAQVHQNQATLEEQYPKLCELRQDSRKALFAEYFGDQFENDLKVDAKDDDKEFTKYLKTRNKTYAIRDWFSLSFATFLGFFGYTSERTEREKYLLALKKVVAGYIEDPDHNYHPVAEQILIGQRPGILRPLFFSSRKNADNKFHEDSLQYKLTAFKQRFMDIENLNDQLQPPPKARQRKAI